MINRVLWGVKVFQLTLLQWSRKHSSHTKCDCLQARYLVFPRLLGVCTGFPEDGRRWGTVIWSWAGEQGVGVVCMRKLQLVLGPAWSVWIHRKGPGDWIRRGGVSGFMGLWWGSWEAEPAVSEVRVSFKERRETLADLRRRSTEVTLCALCSSHWEMYYYEPDEMWTPALGGRAELSSQ